MLRGEERSKRKIKKKNKSMKEKHTTEKTNGTKNWSAEKTDKTASIWGTLIRKSRKQLDKKMHSSERKSGLEVKT